jgi:hypothetical protein
VGSLDGNGNWNRFISPYLRPRTGTHCVCHMPSSRRAFPLPSLYRKPRIGAWSDGWSDGLKSKERLQRPFACFLSPLSTDY